MSEIKTPTEGQIIEAHGDCPEARKVLEKLFPDIFSVLSLKFKQDARVLLKKLEDLIYVGTVWEEKSARARWIIAQLCYSYIPGEVDDELGTPFEELREKTIGC